LLAIPHGCIKNYQTVTHTNTQFIKFDCSTYFLRHSNIKETDVNLYEFTISKVEPAQFQPTI